MSVLAALLAGGALGARHAIEADHLAAVTTLDGQGRVAAPGGAGAWWGVGHALPITTLGLGTLLLGVDVPTGLAGVFEAGAGLLLVGLGAWTVVGLVSPGLHRHAHSGGAHPHLAIGSQLLGASHQHVDPYALAVGVVHGLAGGGALVVALAATSPTRDAGIVFVAAFAATTVLTMVAVSAAWRRLGATARERQLRTVAGVVAIGLGMVMVAAQLGLHGGL